MQFVQYINNYKNGKTKITNQYFSQECYILIPHCTYTIVMYKSTEMKLEIELFQVNFFKYLNT